MRDDVPLGTRLHRQSPSPSPGKGLPCNFRCLSSPKARAKTSAQCALGLVITLGRHITEGPICPQSGCSELWPFATHTVGIQPSQPQCKKQGCSITLLYGHSWPSNAWHSLSTVLARIGPFIIFNLAHFSGDAENWAVADFTKPFARKGNRRVGEEVLSQVLSLGALRSDN
jgi:hypothetical protein